MDLKRKKFVMSSVKTTMIEKLCLETALFCIVMYHYSDEKIYPSFTILSTYCMMKALAICNTILK